MKIVAFKLSLYHGGFQQFSYLTYMFIFVHKNYLKGRNFRVYLFSRDKFSRDKFSRFLKIFAKFAKISFREIFGKSYFREIRENKFPRNIYKIVFSRKFFYVIGRSRMYHSIFIHYIYIHIHVHSIIPSPILI